MDTGTTEVGDEVTGTIDTCDGSGCSEITVEYPGHIDQIKNLIMVSESCSQEISFKCFGSALKINSVHIGWWINANGKLIMVNPKIYLGDKGCFQLLDLIIMELKNHMTCYNLMPLIG